MASGHTQNYYRVDFVWLFCAKRHSSSGFESSKKPNSVPRCTNSCGSHRATSLDYPKFRYSKAEKSALLSATQPRYRPAPISVVPDISCASTAARKCMHLLTAYCRVYKFSSTFSFSYPRSSPLYSPFTTGPFIPRRHGTCLLWAHDCFPAAAKGSHFFP